MLGSLVFFADKNAPLQIAPSPYPVGLICIWELEVVIHERKAWIAHILQQPDSPDFGAYLNDTLT